MSNKSLFQIAVENRIGHNVPLNVRVKLESLKESNVEFSSIGNAWCSYIDVTFSTIYPADEKSSPLNQAADFLSNISLVPKENIAGYEDEVESVTALFKGYIKELRALPCHVTSASYERQNVRVSISVFEPPLTNITDIVSNLNLTVNPKSTYIRKVNFELMFELNDKAVEQGYALSCGDGKAFTGRGLINNYDAPDLEKAMLIRLAHLRELSIINVGNDDALDPNTDPLLIEFSNTLSALCSDQDNSFKGYSVKAKYFTLTIRVTPFIG